MRVCECGGGGEEGVGGWSSDFFSTKRKDCTANAHLKLGDAKVSLFGELAKWLDIEIPKGVEMVGVELFRGEDLHTGGKIHNEKESKEECDTQLTQVMTQRKKTQSRLICTDLH